MSTALIGRQPELALIDELIAGSASGPAGLVLAGEPGIGKSALLHEAIARAESAGRLVLVGAPTYARTMAGVAARPVEITIR